MFKGMIAVIWTVCWSDERLTRSAGAKARDAPINSLKYRDLYQYCVTGPVTAYLTVDGLTSLFINSLTNTDKISYITWKIQEEIISPGLGVRSINEQLFNSFDRVTGYIAYLKNRKVLGYFGYEAKTL